ncbi:MAG TPA: hypothetical protein VHO84_08215 [Syntrophorhabdaceae bacterium]|nr:hypothetical protein [Syntrophorhabdaceae bacterium]
MIAGEDLYAGDRVALNPKDGFVYQATWEDFKTGKYWVIPTNVRKGQDVQGQISAGGAVHFDGDSTSRLDK